MRPEIANRTEWLAGGGEMGRLVRAMDWSKTPLGRIESWPQSLRTTVSLCLSSNFPISVVWGPHHVQIYNDGYWPICGAKHPLSMGQDFTECWASAWPAIGHAFESALAGETRYLENQRMFLDRHGYLEETCFTFSFSPIHDESGGVGGLFHPVTEVTAKMVNDRRMQALRAVTACATGAHSLEEALTLSAQAMSGFDLDLPFAMFYLLNSDGTEARLAAATGHFPPAMAPPLIRLDRADALSWPLQEALLSDTLPRIDDLSGRFGRFECGPYAEAPSRAVLLPITLPGSRRPPVVLVSGASSRLPFDDAYRAFYVLLAGAVGSAIGGACAYAEERQRAEALAEIDRAKTTFFSNVSHELRTPLTLMLGPLEEELAEVSNPLPPDRRGRIQSAHRNSLRLLKLVNALLDFSRIEAGRIQVQYQATDLAQYTTELASNFRSATESAGLSLIVDCPPLGEPVYVDRDMWEKIVLNLLSNAFKHTFEGSIKVSISHCGDWVELAVDDTGVGIPESELPRLFERFHRVPGARSRTHEGTGIGLALVKELVHAHDGTMEVESREGHGSTFRVSLKTGDSHLPRDYMGADLSQSSTAVAGAVYCEEAERWADQTADPIEIAQSAGTGPDHRARILWADDNADMRQYVSRLLSRQYNVVEVSNGKAAVQAAFANPPDLVLSDVMMPELDGLGLLAALRADKRTKMIPVILLSARAGQEAAVDGINAGADDYVVKPFATRELLARIGTNLRLSKLRLESMAVLEERAQEKQYAAVHASEERVREHALVIDQAQIIACDADYRIILWTQGAEALYGFTQAEALGQVVYRLLSTELPEPREEILERLHFNGSWEGELVRRKKDGSRIVTVCRCVVHCVDGKPARYVETGSDVTQLRRTEAELIQAQKMQAIGTLAAGIAHDFNNLLMAIMGHAELAGDALPQGHSARRNITQITAAGERAAELVHQILAFSRPRKAERKLIHLQEVVEEALKLLRSTLPAMVEIRADFEPGICDAVADPSQIHQVIMNLGTNAAHAMEPDGGLLHLQLSQVMVDFDQARSLGGMAAGPYLLLSISDTGKGMDDTTMKQIFDPFFTTKPPGKGTGLGLAVVHGIVSNHHGAIHVESKPGEGTVFRLHLPVSNSVLSTPVVRTVAMPRGEGKRVLCIDDEPSVLAVVVQRLEKLGYQVSSHADASTALSKFRAAPEQFDGVLTDLAMPGISGLDLASELRGVRRDVPIVLMSGHLSDEDQERIRQIEITECLEKPNTVENFAATLFRAFHKA